MLISTVYQSDSVLYIYIYKTYIFSFIFFSIMFYLSILNIVPVLNSRTLLFIHSVYNSGSQIFKKLKYS